MLRVQGVGALPDTVAVMRNHYRCCGITTGVVALNDVQVICMFLFFFVAS